MSTNPPEKNIVQVASQNLACDGYMVTFIASVKYQVWNCKTSRVNEAEHFKGHQGNDQESLLPSWSTFLRPVCFVFRRARAPMHFLLCKGHPDEEFVNFYWSIWKTPRGHGGRLPVASVKYIRPESWGRNKGHQGYDRPGAWRLLKCQTWSFIPFPLSAGAITSSISLAYTISKFASGILSDKLSARVMFSTGLMIASLLVLQFTSFNTMNAFMIIMFLNGLAQGGGWPGCSKILKKVGEYGLDIIM